MQRFLVRLAISNVMKTRLRSFLAIGGVALSTAVMVLLFGLGMGLQSMVTDQIARTSEKNVITVSTKNATHLRLDQGAISRLQSISGVTSVEQAYNISGEVTYNGITLLIPLYGVTGGYFDLTPSTIVKGTVANQFGNADHNIVLSTGALKAFGLNNNVVGKQMNVNFTIVQSNDSKMTDASREVASKGWTVHGVIDKGAAPVGYVPAEYLVQHGVDSASTAKVQVAYPEKVGTIRQSIEQLGYDTANIQDDIAQVDKIFKVIKGILVAFAVITVIVTVFSTMNTITIELVEGTQQIGFLRIMGIRREDVGRLFVMQSLILSTSGVVLGCIAGVIFGLLTNGAVQALAVKGIGSGDHIYIYQIPGFSIIIMLMLAVALGWAIGVLPARRAVTISPLDALKT